MGLSLEERKRKLIEDVCASCAGGGGADTDTNTSADEGIGDPNELMKGLSLLRKAKSKRLKRNGS
jgi:hypothetical protein